MQAGRSGAWGRRCWPVPLTAGAASFFAWGGQSGIIWPSWAAVTNREEKMAGPLRAVVFDLEDTLYDCTGTLLEASRQRRCLSSTAST